MRFHEDSSIESSLSPNSTSSPSSNSSSKSDEKDPKNDDDIDDDYFKCAASDLCTHLKESNWKSNMITKSTQNIKLCTDCKYYAHKECVKKRSFIKRKTARGDLVCILCSKMYDGDGDPTISSMNPDDNVSKKNNN